MGQTIQQRQLKVFEACATASREKALKDIRDAGQFHYSGLPQLQQMCKQINDAPGKVYEIISLYGGMADTVTREAIFAFIADEYHGGDYGQVYDAWLEEGPSV